MKQPWWALLIVAVFGIGAGIGAATLLGGESSSADGAAATTSSVDTTAPDTTSVPTTSEPEPTTTTAPPTTTTTTAPPTTTTTPAPATTTPAPPQPPLSEVQIVVSNGAGIPLIAGATAELLRNVGYPVVEIADGSILLPVTSVFVAPGLEPTAEQMIADILAIDPGFIAPAGLSPLTESPPVLPAFPDADIILYLGQDQA